MPARFCCAKGRSIATFVVTLVIALVACEALAVDAYADAPLAEPRRAERRVVVVDAGSDALDEELFGALTELLGRLHLDLVRSGSASTAPVVARVVIESSERGAVVTVTGTAGASIRREVERGDSAALFRETLAHVILGAVEPLASMDDEAPSAEAAPPPAAPDLAPREATERSLALSFGARAGPRLLATDQASIGFSGLVALTLRTPLRPSAAIQAGYVLPARLSRDDIDAQFGLVPIRIQAGIEPLAAKNIALDAALVGGVDVVWLTPETGPALAHLESSTTRLQPMFGAMASGRFRLTSRTDLVLTLGVDADAAPRLWVIAVGAAHDSLFETARFRPYAALGLDFTMGAPISTSTREASR